MADDGWGSGGGWGSAPAAVPGDTRNAWGSGGGWGSAPAAEAGDTGNAWGVPVKESKDGGEGWGVPVEEAKDGGGGWGVPVEESKDGDGGWGVPVGESKDGDGGWGVPVGESKDGDGGWGVPAGECKDGDGGWGAPIGAEDGGGGGGWEKQQLKRDSDGPAWGGKDGKRPRGDKEKGGEFSELPDFLDVACPDEVVRVRIDIPPGSSGKIIGKAGATIKALQDCIPGYVQIKLEKESNQVVLTSDNIACVEKAESLIETLLARADAKNWRPDVSVSCLQASQGASRLLLHRLPKEAYSRCLREFVSLSRDVYVFQSAEPEAAAAAAAEEEAQPGGGEANGGPGAGAAPRRCDSRLVCVDWVGGKTEALLPGFAEVIKAAAGTYRKGTHVKVQAQIVKSYFRPRLGPEVQLEASISAGVEEMQENLATGNWTLQSSNPYDEESIALARAGLAELGFSKVLLADTVTLHFEHNESKNKYTVSVKLRGHGDGDGDGHAAEETEKEKMKIKFKKGYKRHAFFSFLRGCPEGEFRLLVKTRPAGNIMAEPFASEDTAEIEEIVRGVLGERTSDGLLKIPEAGGEYTHAVTVVRYKGVEVFSNQEFKVGIKRVRMQAAGRSEVISRWEVSVESLPLKEHLLSGSMQPEVVSCLLGALVAFTTGLTQSMGAVGCLTDLDSSAAECTPVGDTVITTS